MNKLPIVLALSGAVAVILAPVGFAGVDKYVLDRRCIVPNADINADTVLNKDSTGMSSKNRDEVPRDSVGVDATLVGRQTKVDLKADRCVRTSQLEPARFDITMPIGQVVVASAATLKPGAKVHVILAPKEGQDDSKGVVVGDVVVSTLTDAEIVLSVPVTRETDLADRLGRSTVILVATNE